MADQIVAEETTPRPWRRAVADVFLKLMMGLRGVRSR